MREEIDKLIKTGNDARIKIRQVKVFELRGVIQFILNNQKYPVFFLHGTIDAPNKNQGKMWLTVDDNMPVLFVNWDECFAFDEQQELFERLFEGDFSNDKLVKITGIKTCDY